MDISINWDAITAIGIIFIIFYIIYSRMKNQTLRDTYDEIKELFSPVGDEI